MDRGIRDAAGAQPRRFRRQHSWVVAPVFYHPHRPAYRCVHLNRSNEVNKQYLGLSVDEVVASVRVFVERLRQTVPETDVFLLSTLPKSRSTQAHRTETPLSNELNERYTALADEEGVTYVDIASVVTAKDGALRSDYTFDGGHVNGAGYTAIIEIVRPYVEAALGYRIAREWGTGRPLNRLRGPLRSGVEWSRLLNAVRTRPAHDRPVYGSR